MILFGIVVTMHHCFVDQGSCLVMDSAASHVFALSHRGIGVLQRISGHARGQAGVIEYVVP
ncbi:hypothetical protein ACIRRA_45045 [Nocardia sp. NPDC101769]|uniref:hypothetical protein n=1 Tax=Nocardia sp. NPDC101769 TaxID=3364333 RepID=UPI0037F41BEC